MSRRTSPLRQRRPIYRRRRLTWQTAIVVVVVALGIRYLAEERGTREVAPAIEPAVPEQEYLVQRVVDGDTLLLANRQRIRLIGVDTPETVAPDRPVERFGPEASAFTRRMVEGRRVRLGFDKERIDRFGRYLAYVYVDERAVMLNEELIRAGLSKAQLQYPYSNAMKRRFRDAENEARAHQRGLWSVGALPEIRPAPKRAA